MEENERLKARILELEEWIRALDEKYGNLLLRVDILTRQVDYLLKEIDKLKWERR